MNASLVPAAVTTSLGEKVKSHLDAALHVKDVEKSTICTWYLALFCIFAIVYFIQIIGIMSVLPNLKSAWVLLPILIGDLVVLANLYFYYAMCEKLPEGFIGTIIQATK